MPATPVNANGAASGALPVIPTTVYGTWVTIHADLEATAESAANLLRPTSSTVSASVVPLRVGANTRMVLIRARYDPTATVTTSPVVRLTGLHCAEGVEVTSTIPDDGTVVPIRLDNLDSGATGLTITLDATNDIRDGTYRYSDVVSLTPIDMLGARYLVALVSTAANTSTGSVVLQALLLN